MGFPSSILDEIKQRLTISEIVGRYVTWDKRKSLPAKGDYWACCPFHGEKTPSFHADDRREHYYCFGCKASGNIFDFLIAQEGIDFIEAVERLASDAGVKLPSYNKQSAMREKQQLIIYDVLELTKKFFINYLHSSMGRVAMDYLISRGVDSELQKQFHIGYAPSGRNMLLDYLKSNGVSEQMMVRAGLVVTGDDIKTPYDRFRERIIFPITNRKDQVIAFGGRALLESNPAKYLNSPETELFHKGNILYNYARARKPSYEAGEMLVVEGYMDVISLSRVGFNNVVAPLGTALTAEQIKILWKTVNEPVLCFDGDKAGISAASRAADTVLPILKPGYSLRFAFLPEGCDPDDLAREGGNEAVKEILSNAKYLPDVLWEREVLGVEWTTPERRALLEANIEKVLVNINDKKIKYHYENDFKNRLYGLWRNQKSNNLLGNKDKLQQKKYFTSAKGKVRQWEFQSSPSKQLQSLVAKQSNSNSNRIREIILLAGIINHAFLLDKFGEELAAVEFIDVELNNIRKFALDIYALSEHINRDDLIGALQAKYGTVAIDKILSKADSETNWFVGIEAAKKDTEIGWVHVLRLHNKELSLRRDLLDAERAFANEPNEVNLSYLKGVREQINNLDNEKSLVDGYGEASGRIISKHNVI